MASNFLKFPKGINLVPNNGANPATEMGDLTVDSSSGKLTYRDASSSRPVVTESGTATLTGKTINATSNTITNLDNASIATGAGIARSKLAASSVPNSVALNDSSGNLTSSTALRFVSGILTLQDRLALAGATSGSVGLQAPAVAGSAVYTLPNADGAPGSALVTNGSGSLSWSATGSGASLALDNLTATSINQSLVPNSILRELGSPSSPWGSLYTNNIQSSGDLNVNSNKIINVANPTDLQDAATKAYVDGAVSASGANLSLSNLTTTSINQNLLPDVDITRNLGSGALRFGTLNALNINSGGNGLSIITGINNVNVNNSRITQLGTPSAATDAVTKAYADLLGFPAPTRPTLSSGAAIATLPSTAKFHHYIIESGGLTVSTTPFGATAPADGSIIVLRGPAEDIPPVGATVIPDASGTSRGCRLVGGVNFSMTNNSVLVLMYLANSGRYHELFRRT